MRRFTMVAVVMLGVAGLIVLLVGPAGAAAPAAYTNYHQTTNLVCSDCHTMHGSLAHDYGATTGGATYSAPGANKLLKTNTGQTGSDLCLSCHGGATTAPDVLQFNSNNYVRSGGALNTTTAAEGYDTYMGHTIGSTATAPGGAGSFVNASGLSCMDCHNNHGSTNFRNLKTTVNATGVTLTAKVGTHNEGTSPTADLVVDVGGAATRTPFVTGPGNAYKAENVWHYTNTPNNRYATLCGACHKTFDTAADKHPTGVALGGSGTLESQYTTDYLTEARVPVLAPNYAVASPFAPATGFQPTCASCHKAHGNKNSFGLLMFGATTTKGAATEEGEASQTATTFTCQQCHTQGT